MTKSNAIKKIKKAISGKPYRIGYVKFHDLQTLHLLINSGQYAVAFLKINYAGRFLSVYSGTPIDFATDFVDVFNLIDGE